MNATDKFLAANAQVVAGFEQVPLTAGTAVRMAVLYLLGGGQEEG